MSKFHINKHGVPAPCRATKGNCPLGGEGEHFNTQQEAQAHIDKTSEEKHGFLPGIEAVSNDVEISKEHADSMFPDAHFNNGYFSSGPHKGEINEGVRDGDRASIALKNALPKELFENNETFTLVPEKNAEAFYKNTIITPFSDDAPESHYENMVATVKEKSPNSVSDENGWDEINQDLSDKIAKFAAEKSLEESNTTINGSKVIVADYKERNWAKEYFKSKEKHIKISKEHADSMFPDSHFNNGYFSSGPHKGEINEGVRDGDEASIALKKALPPEIFKNNDTFTLVPEKNAEDFYKNTIITPFSDDAPESHYENMVATVKAKSPNSVSDEYGWDEINQDLSGKIAKFAAEKSLKESNVSINGSKVIVADYKERNWAEEYFKSKE